MAKLSSINYCRLEGSWNNDAPAETDGEPLAQDGVAVLLLVQANGDQVPSQSLHTASQSAKQGCGSGSGLDPYSIGLVDPDPYSESGSGSRRAKMTHKRRKKFVKVHVLKCWMASFES